jgi:hypothetical protein
VEANVNRYLGGPKDPITSVGPGSVDLLTGNFSTSDSDVSIPTFNSSLEFARSYNSRHAPVLKDSAEGIEEAQVGPRAGLETRRPGRRSGRLRMARPEDRRRKRRIRSFSYAVLTTLEGGELAFEKTPAGTYAAPPEVTGWSLNTEAGNFVLTDPVGNRTTFSNLGTGEYVPIAISQSGGANTTRVEYEVKEIEGKKLKRVHMVVAPPPPGVTCNSELEATTTSAGCRTLIFTYLPATHWGAPAADGERLASVTDYAPGNGGPWEVAKYEYNGEGRLTEEWDPRITPALKEKYAYGPNGELTMITPPGLEPWTLEYGVCPVVTD